MGGTTAYFTGTSDPSSFLSYLLKPSWGGSGFAGSGSSSSSEMDNLYKLVRPSVSILSAEEAIGCPVQFDWRVCSKSRGSLSRKIASNRF